MYNNAFNLELSEWNQKTLKQISIEKKKKLQHTFMSLQNRLDLVIIKKKVIIKYFRITNN